MQTVNPAISPDRELRSFLELRRRVERSGYGAVFESFRRYIDCLRGLDGNSNKLISLWFWFQSLMRVEVTDAALRGFLFGIELDFLGGDSRYYDDSPNSACSSVVTQTTFEKNEEEDPGKNDVVMMETLLSGKSTPRTTPDRNDKVLLFGVSQEQDTFVQENGEETFLNQERRSPRGVVSGNGSGNWSNSSSNCSSSFVTPKNLGLMLEVLGFPDFPKNVITHRTSFCPIRYISHSIIQLRLEGAAQGCKRLGEKHQVLKDKFTKLLSAAKQIIRLVSNPEAIYIINKMNKITSNLREMVDLVHKYELIGRKVLTHESSGIVQDSSITSTNFYRFHLNLVELLKNFDVSTKKLLEQLKSFSELADVVCAIHFLHELVRYHGAVVVKAVGVTEASSTAGSSSAAVSSSPAPNHPNRKSSPLHFDSLDRKHMGSPTKNPLNNPFSFVGLSSLSSVGSLSAVTAKSDSTASDPRDSFFREILYISTVGNVNASVCLRYAILIKWCDWSDARAALLANEDFIKQIYNDHPYESFLKEKMGGWQPNFQAENRNGGTPESKSPTTALTSTCPGSESGVQPNVSSSSAQTSQNASSSSAPSVALHLLASGLRHGCIDSLCITGVLDVDMVTAISHSFERRTRDIQSLALLYLHSMRLVRALTGWEDAKDRLFREEVNEIQNSSLVDSNAISTGGLNPSLSGRQGSGEGEKTEKMISGGAQKRSPFIHVATKTEQEVLVAQAASLPVMGKADFEAWAVRQELGTNPDSTTAEASSKKMVVPHLSGFPSSPTSTGAVLLAGTILSPTCGVSGSPRGTAKGNYISLDTIISSVYNTTSKSAMQRNLSFDLSDTSNVNSRPTVAGKTGKNPISTNSYHVDLSTEKLCVGGKLPQENLSSLSPPTKITSDMLQSILFEYFRSKKSELIPELKSEIHGKNPNEDGKSHDECDLDELNRTQDSNRSRDDSSSNILSKNRYDSNPSTPGNRSNRSDHDRTDRNSEMSVYSPGSSPRILLDSEIMLTGLPDNNALLVDKDNSKEKENSINSIGNGILNAFANAIINQPQLPPGMSGSSSGMLISTPETTHNIIQNPDGNNMPISISNYRHDNNKGGLMRNLVGGSPPAFSILGGLASSSQEITTPPSRTNSSHDNIDGSNLGGTSNIGGENNPSKDYSGGNNGGDDIEYDHEHSSYLTVYYNAYLVEVLKNLRPQMLELAKLEYPSRIHGDISSEKHDNGAVLYCYFCALPLSGEIPKQLHGRNIAIDPQIEPICSFCPNARCKKPLPKCVVCLLPMECSNHKTLVPNSPDVYVRLPIGKWTTFCQTCHHGGHTSCIMSYFEKYNCCPVPDCGCKCGGGDEIGCGGG